jgi:Ca2+-binding RTX toxin-like protein
MRRIFSVVFTPITDCQIWSEYFIDEQQSADDSHAQGTLVRGLAGNAYDRGFPMPTRTEMLAALSSIGNNVKTDPGLLANISQADINGGVAAGKKMDEVIVDAILKIGAMNDGIITPDEVRRISDAIRADAAQYAKFIDGHGDDEGDQETGFHLVQNDGGTLMFQGRKFVDTVADAIYHIGFTYDATRFVNEDGDQNEEVDDITGWLNYFLTGVNRVFGTAAADELYSGEYSAQFAAARNETFTGGGGDDAIWAGDGNDTVYGGIGNDRSGGGTGADRMLGEDGDDDLYGETGNDWIYGGAGIDDLGGGDGDDRLWGDAGSDSIGGGNGNDSIDGGSEDDTIWGEAGNDGLIGGTGNDRMGGGSGFDTLIGGDGNDTLYGDEQADRLFGGAGTDTLGGGDGVDYLYGGDGNDLIYAGAADDRLTGDYGADQLYGSDGHDWIDGGHGNDMLSGGNGNDNLRGGDWNDELSGGNGVDFFVGGRGADKLYDWEDTDATDYFIFAAGDSGVTAATRDVIEGFDSGVDKIDLRSIAGLKFRDGEVTFAGGGTKSCFFWGTMLFVDTTGDAVTDMTIELKWVGDLTPADFLLA